MTERAPRLISLSQKQPSPRLQTSQPASRRRLRREPIADGAVGLGRAVDGDLAVGSFGLAAHVERGARPVCNRLLKPLTALTSPANTERVQACPGTLFDLLVLGRILSLPGVFGSSPRR